LNHFGITPTANIQKGTVEESGLVRPKNLTMNSTHAQHTLRIPLLSLDEVSKQISRTISSFKRHSK
ncbi:MAG: hypothetical protein ABI618_19300, partial [Nitrospirota bacterium]